MTRKNKPIQNKKLDYWHFKGFTVSVLIFSVIYKLRKTFLNFHNSRKLNQKKIISIFQVKQLKL